MLNLATLAAIRHALQAGPADHLSGFEVNQWSLPA